MKKLFVFLSLILLLVGCTNTATEVSKEKVDVSNQTNIKEIKTVTFVPTDEYEIKKTNGNVIQKIRFHGFTSQTTSGEWIVSFSQSANWEVNNFYIVKEGTSIKIHKATVEIVKLEPDKNRITVKIATE